MEVRCEFPASVELRNALGGLLDIAPGSDRLVVAVFDHDYGEAVPVATIVRHPGCPVDEFERTMGLIKRMLDGEEV